MSRPAFVDVTAASGTGDIHKGHGVAFADLPGFLLLIACPVALAVFRFAT